MHEETGGKSTETEGEAGATPQGRKELGTFEDQPGRQCGGAKSTWGRWQVEVGAAGADTQTEKESETRKHDRQAVTERVKTDPEAKR